MQQQQAEIRPPAVPLVTMDPYCSVWSTSDRLSDQMTKHWTGTIMPLTGMARIDGSTYRFIGSQPNHVPPMAQVAMELLPTRTIYVFEHDGIRMTLTFTTPLLPDNLDILSRPVTYLSWDVAAIDGRSHEVLIYLDVTAEWVVNLPEQPVAWARFRLDGMSVMRVGSEEQPVLEKSGNNLRIDWGHLYLAVPQEGGCADVMTGNRAARGTFAARGALPYSDDLRMPRPASDDWPALACVCDLGEVGATAVSRHVILAYDDYFSIDYFHRKLRPYWRRNGTEADSLLRWAEKSYHSLIKRCVAFDTELMADLEQLGGREYALLGALAYRQCLAAHKLATDFDGTPLYFSKENFSSGCVSTLDVTFPTSPLLLLLNHELVKALLTPIFDYARSPKWKHPFAPHDLGIYPHVRGQAHGGGEKTEENQMPVEECGNALILTAAIARMDGNADYALRYWPLLTRWAEYLRENGFDPERQLCTDTFTGHLAHGTNLSIKAILGIGAYAQLCELAGQPEKAADYRSAAENMARAWVDKSDDGDHYRLAFDRPDTWSLKYNLIWDQLLGLNLFPPSVARKEVAFYRTRLNRYGVPLDSRRAYTTVNWMAWAGALSESKEDFREFVRALLRYANETPDRVPLADWYGTVDGKRCGFQARPVVGGVFIRMLTDPAIWEKWSQKAKKPTGE